MSELSSARQAMTEAEMLIRKACSEREPASRSTALIQAYRLAPTEIQFGIVMGLIARVAMEEVAGAV